MELLVFLVPILVIPLFWLTSNKKVIYSINAIGSTALLSVTALLVKEVIDSSKGSIEFLFNLIYVDSLSALILLVTTVIFFLVSLYSIWYIDEELKRKIISIQKIKIFYSLLYAFVFTMLLTVSSQNMGVMWISIEATTLASAFLVGFYNDRKSIEAAWKYIIICSVGIAFALLGIVLLYYSSIQALGQSMQGINWQFLFENANKLQGSILKISFIFILVGFGTKVGLAPMHTWLPDAHSQAPSPISALLSGVLLNTAMYGIIRVMVIVNKNLGDSKFTGRLLMALGLISIGTAAIFILVQHDFKRLLAYSSIEHMGIIAFGLGILSPLSVFGALYHIFNHAFTKSMLFLASGNVYLKYDTKKINKVQGVMKVMPITGLAFILGVFAITGMPPFSIFSSELNIIISSFEKSNYFGAVLLLLFLILIFAGFVTQILKMFYGNPVNKGIKPGETSILSSGVLVVLLLVIAITGLYLPGPIKHLIDAAKEIIILKNA